MAGISKKIKMKTRQKRRESRKRDIKQLAEDSRNGLEERRES